MIWLPEPHPRLMFSPEHRYHIRRIARGYALYDRATGEFIGKYFSLAAAVRVKRIKKALLRQTRDNR